MKSDANVRCDENQPFESTNPIVYQSIVNVIHQTVKLLCIIGVVQEVCKVLLSCHRVHRPIDLC